MGSGATAARSSAEAQGDGEEGEGDEEPEDDYNAAWEVLDVARTIYAKMVEGKAEAEMREETLNLAECYLALGDVSCETGVSLPLTPRPFNLASDTLPS